MHVSICIGGCGGLSCFCTDKGHLGSFWLKGGLTPFHMGIKDVVRAKLFKSCKMTPLRINFFISLITVCAEIRRVYTVIYGAYTEYGNPGNPL
jgi:hypothetical protein